MGMNLDITKPRYDEHILPLLLYQGSTVPESVITFSVSYVN